MDCNFNRHIQRAKTTVRVEVQEIPQRDSYHSIISKDSKIDEDVEKLDKSGIVEVDNCFWSALWPMNANKIEGKIFQDGD